MPTYRKTQKISAKASNTCHSVNRWWNTREMWCFLWHASWVMHSSSWYATLRTSSNDTSNSGMNKKASSAKNSKAKRRKTDIDSSLTKINPWRKRIRSKLLQMVVTLQHLRALERDSQPSLPNTSQCYLQLNLKRNPRRYRHENRQL